MFALRKDWILPTPPLCCSLTRIASLVRLAHPIATMVSTDVSMYITSRTVNSEQRITPSWTISHFRNRVERITGIPSSCQRLLIRPSVDSTDETEITAQDETASQLAEFNLRPYGQIYVSES